MSAYEGLALACAAGASAALAWLAIRALKAAVSDDHIGEG